MKRPAAAHAKKFPAEVIRQLKSRGYTILLVEQSLDFAMSVADRHHVVEHGQVVESVGNDQLVAAPASLQSYLGV